MCSSLQAISQRYEASGSVLCVLRIFQYYCGMPAESHCEASRAPLLGNDSAITPVARQWFNRCHVMAATDTHATISGRHPQGAWRQDELIGGKPPVVNYLWLSRLEENKNLGHGFWWDLEPRTIVLPKTSSQQQAVSQLRAADVWSEKLVAEGGDNSGTQRKGNVHC
jgi:hypothetical protein